MLANVVRKPMAQIFHEFSGSQPKANIGEYTGSGDVKYHLGTSYNRPTINGKMVHLSLLANPSHLEAVNTVVLGKTRAKQYYTDDHHRSQNLPVLLHGDGAFSGQGIVFETLDMSGLPDYTVGGTIHIVVNNQVGASTTHPAPGLPEGRQQAHHAGAPGLGESTLRCCVRVCGCAASCGVCCPAGRS